MFNIIEIIEPLNNMFEHLDDEALYPAFPKGFNISYHEMSDKYEVRKYINKYINKRQSSYVYDELGLSVLMAMSSTPKKESIYWQIDDIQFVFTKNADMGRVCSSAKNIVDRIMHYLTMDRAIIIESSISRTYPDNRAIYQLKKYAEQGVIKHVSDNLSWRMVSQWILTGYMDDLYIIQTVDGRLSMVSERLLFLKYHGIIIDHDTGDHQVPHSTFVKPTVRVRYDEFPYKDLYDFSAYENAYGSTLYKAITHTL